MSCNGCRILRKGCNENCILRQSLQGIESPQAQANATVFVAKFFGRAGLMSFLSSVPESQRPALFQSLLFEACGRTVNPVNGAVGLLWTGNWNLCQSAVETVLRGGVPRRLPEFCGGSSTAESEASETNDADGFGSGDLNVSRPSKGCRRKVLDDVAGLQARGVDLNLTSGLQARTTPGGMISRRSQKRRPTTPSVNSDESETTTLESASAYKYTQNLPSGNEKFLRFFF